MCERVVSYMKRTSDYRNPDITLNSMATSLFTNRTTLSKALRDLGYINFNAYINSLRIEDFINRVNNERIYNYQDHWCPVKTRLYLIKLFIVNMLRT